MNLSSRRDFIWSTLTTNKISIVWKCICRIFSSVWARMWSWCLLWRGRSMSKWLITMARYLPSTLMILKIYSSSHLISVIGEIDSISHIMNPWMDKFGKASKNLMVKAWTVFNVMTLKPFKSTLTQAKTPFVDVIRFPFSSKLSIILN